MRTLSSAVDECTKNFLRVGFTMQEQWFPQGCQCIFYFHFLTNFAVGLQVLSLRLLTASPT